MNKVARLICVFLNLFHVFHVTALSHFRFSEASDLGRAIFRVESLVSIKNDY